MPLLVSKTAEAGKTGPVTQCITITEPTQFTQRGRGAVTIRAVDRNNLAVATLTQSAATHKEYVAGEYCVTISASCHAVEVYTDAILDAVGSDCPPYDPEGVLDYWGSPPPIPDFTTTTLPQNTNVVGASGDVDTRIQISEINGGDSDGVTPLVINISHDDRLVLTYNPTATDLNGDPVNNSDWAFTEPNPFIYRFTYIGNGGVFPANGESYIGLDMVFNPAPLTSGTQDVSSTITAGSGGEDNPANNTDTFTITYDNLAPIL